jgi:hypothetical protein
LAPHTLPKFLKIRKYKIILFAFDSVWCETKRRDIEYLRISCSREYLKRREMGRRMEKTA